MPDETNGRVYCSPYLGNDGYDEIATVPAHPGKWPEIRLSYRCMSADEESEAREKAKRFTGKSPVRHFAELFATKIKDWDLKDRAGAKLPVTADAIACLTPQFYDLLHSYLDGTMPSDSMRESLEAEQKNSLAGSG